MKHFSLQFILTILGTLTVADAQPRKASVTAALDSQIMRIYSQHFHTYDTVNNMPWDCGGNALDLFLELEREDLIKERKAFIVHTFYEYDFKLDAKNRPLSRVLIPLKARRGHPWWAFHAFLVLDEVVLDQYYTDQPQALDLDRYLSLMWGDENLHDLHFQIIPAQQYRRTQEWGHSPSMKLHPQLNHEQLKAQLQKM
ncbi:MAG: hypothetical protein AB7N80_04965 [Bdellovibrionales bacterium]